MTTAVCVTGLERTFKETHKSIFKNVLHSGKFLFFGIALYDWKIIVYKLNFTRIIQQSPCYIKTSENFIPKFASKNHQRNMCNQAGCKRIILEHETQNKIVFDRIMYLRPDLYWETTISLPKCSPYEIHVPAFNHCGGICDKFAIGGRKAMYIYFDRGKHVWKTKKKYFSEHFLLNSVKTQNIIRHHDWIFCKFKRFGWKQCTNRIKLEYNCTFGFSCPWCGSGCSCNQQAISI